ncbi:MAG: carbohydrate-binding protein [Myxococcales bacterium]|nr:carbohydrate-binding protein [Myxococcales bacterium]
MSTLRDTLASWFHRDAGADATTVGIDELPLRAELYSVSQLEQHARTLGAWHRLGPPGARVPDTLLPRLAANEVALREAHALVTEAVHRGRRITPAAEWFIDNYHLIEEQIRTARRHLPRTYNRELPRLARTLHAGVPRIYDLVLELVSHTHGRLDLESLRAFIAAYQSVPGQTLRLGELWAIPIMLRLALLENLRRVVDAVVAGRRDREAAGHWVERMIEVAAATPAKVVLVLAEMVAADPTLSNAFLAEMASRLQGQGPALVFPSTWLEQRLAERGQTVEHVFQLVSQSQAADQVAIGNSIGSLRLLGATDWREFVESMSAVEARLTRDPVGVYAAMDFATRDRYRHVVEAIARRSPVSEAEVAEAAVGLASAGVERRAHVGWYLVDAGRPALEAAVGMRPGLNQRLRRAAQQRRFALYIVAVVGLTLGLGATAWSLAFAGPAAALPGWVRAAALGLLMLASSQLALALVHWAATLLARPGLLPRLDFSAGIPAAHRTAVAVPTLLTDPAEVDHLLDAMEVRYLANRDPQLAFVLLTDFRDAAEEQLDGDAALLERARAGVLALNARHAEPGRRPPFYLLHRPRRWNPREGAWMGWERKRGKLEQFNEALRGRLGGFSTIVGEPRELRDVKYVIVLDSDTQLPRDAARELAGTLAHPLNRPRLDARLGRVVEGYAILQPRVAITMDSARRSGFARLFAGESGIDPYTRAVSDVYQDLFDEGSFVGKGIYDVDAFQAAIGGKLPENRVLSHDLLEGAYARAGLVSDVLLFEDYPSAYSVEVSRRHRWTRGDWQIATWLRGRVPGGGEAGRVRNPISWLSRWKIVDNLRRSVVPTALLALLGLGWATPGLAGPATLVVLAILVLPGLLVAAALLTRRPGEVTLRRHVREIGRGLGSQLAREAFALACLPHDALVGASAICHALTRVWVTGRKLLEWRTASDAQRGAATGLGQLYTFMAIAPIAGLVALVGLALTRPAALAWAAPVALAWLLAPALAWRLGRPSAPESHALAAADLRFLRGVARRTWRFFETFIADEDNHLPPDNFQVDPPQGIAHRTSPTNIGLALTANLAAYDFGYLAADEVLARCTRTMAAMDRLQRYRGHFYNWYDTRTLAPLRPIYISTVDSGNLAGHLLTLNAGLLELVAAPIFRPAIYEGLRDTLAQLAEHAPDDAEVQAGLLRVGEALAEVPATLAGVVEALARLREETAALALTVAGRGEEATWWARALADQVARAGAELAWIAPWAALAAPQAGELAEALGRLAAFPSLAEVAALEHSLVPVQADARAGAAERAGYDELRAALVLAASRAADRVQALRQLGARACELADLDYEFLYDRERHLLTIGYNVDDNRLDASFYDLLASEARLASYVAIAQGKLPQEHWFRLGRSLTSSGGQPALLSWSGSMFEYLMPLLIMPTYRGTILDATYRGVVARQIEYGGERGVPWGVSESGYNKTDAHLNYQYRAFGVPGLGFKRGLADDLVIAPYACAMALMVAPEAATENLRRLAREGRLGPHGFYEAVDYTPARLPRGQDSATVCSYMAHHQGMSFLALVYLLRDRPMQRRFAADASFRATDLLLQERVPRAPAIYPHPAEVSAAAAASAEGEHNVRVFTTAATPSPQVQLLSNGRYHVMVSNGGGGYSRWRDLAVTRWHEDPTRDAAGSACYLRDASTGVYWSVAHQPTLVIADRYEAIFSQGRAEFRRTDGTIETHVEISVSPEDDVELRRINLTNRGEAPRTIELTSYAEVVLANPAADASHPAFSNLFVQTELVRPRQAILCARRPRSASEAPPTMFHLMTVQGRLAGAPSYETRRSQFIGRGRSPQDPQALHRTALGDGEGSVLDPVVAIRNTVLIGPGETVRVHLVTGIAETRDGALALVDKYSDRHSADRVFSMAWTHSQVLLRRLDATEADTQLYDRLASNILYSSPALRAPRSVIARNQRGQSSLWAYAISGDLPIALVRIGDIQHIGLVRQLVQAHAYLRLKGLALDLIVWNEDRSGYRQVLHDDILGAVAALGATDLLDRPGGIFIRRTDQISEEDKVLLQTVARLIVVDTDGTLTEQLNRRQPIELPTQVFAGKGRPPEAALAPARKLRIDRPDLTGWNGLGGFTSDGREYVITTTRAARTPAPWVNVLANPYFGTVVSESGGAYTWCENARNYRLTPWHNDPISDPGGEAFYLRDEHDGRFWSPTAAPAGGSEPYTARHGFGYSVFEYVQDGIASEMRTFVATDAPLKFMLFTLTNHSGRPRRLSLTALFELVLGEQRASNAPYVVTEVDPGSGALLARNCYAAEFSRRVAFLDCSERQRSFTCDRLEFLGRNGSQADPLCMDRARLSGRVGAGLDPCLAMQVMVDLADGQSRELVFSFGSGMDLADARTLIHRFQGVGAARAALAGVWAYWNRTLGAVHVRTPEPSLDFLANGWLVYQTLAARMWGRSGFYQSGGAFGFRDQLQDAMALVHAEPALLRQQIVRSAGRQFREGDVQHWWHPPMGRGVRTRISDDYLWLPYAVSRYVGALADTGVLDERAPFLEGRPVKPDEESYYDLPLASEETATIYEHCVRAVEHGLRLGERGLPLMGSGDWNDGMNLVGEHGQGESVWLAFFLHDVLRSFVPVARLKQDEAFAARCLAAAARLGEAIAAHGWDGGWYRRAYFDSGEPLGSASNSECQIDSLPQSWSVLARVGDPARARAAMAAVDTRLVKRDLGLIQLFDPPFDHSPQNPGYVKGYVPGVRENGGQYTHAAIWAVMAFAAAGERERAWELFRLINPIHHGNTPATIARYKVEPYVVAADVYTNPQHAGRGGWTWYTGSAAWMYRLTIESLLGLHLEVDHLRVEPLMPAGWERFEVNYRWRRSQYHIRVHGPAAGGQGVLRVVCDGQEQPGRVIPLSDDGGQHQAEVWVGPG